MQRGYQKVLVLVVSSLLPLILSKPAEPGDAFLKGGLIFHPRDSDIATRWLVDVGSDYPVNTSETLFLGFDILASVYRIDVRDPSQTAVVARGDGFINIKYKSGRLGARPYAGGGIGLISESFFVSGGNQWLSDMGWHVMGGIEFRSITLELMTQRAFGAEPDTGSNTEYSVLLGFVW